MRKRILGIGLLAMALFGLVLGGVAAYKGTPGPNPDASQSLADGYSTYYAPLSTDEENGLLYMVEEEKLARDVYLTLYNQTGLTVFSNIAQSEQRHMDAVLGLIDKYNLTAPDTLNEVGVFQNQDLQALYNQLIEMGSKNVTSALEVGALIEETDIKDLQEWMAKTDNADIKNVYEHLMIGSDHHLKAFTQNLESYGVTYTPQVLSEDEYNAILNSTDARGHGMMGHGHGKMAHGHGMKGHGGHAGMGFRG